MKNNQKGSAEVTFIIIIGLIILVPLLIYIFGMHINTGSGEHTGYVTSVEKTGLFWKTGRAYVKSDVSSSQEDMYCVIDENIYTQLEEKSVNKEKVTIQYFSWIGSGVSNCAGEGDIIKALK